MDKSGRKAQVGAQRPARLAPSHGPLLLCPEDADSSGALIYTAADPDQLHPSGSARRSPWRFPFRHLIPIREILLCPKSSAFPAITAWPTQGGIFNPSPSSYHALPAQCRVPTANPAPSRALPASRPSPSSTGAATCGAGGLKHGAQPLLSPETSAIPAGTEGKRAFQRRADVLEELSGSRSAESGAG